MNRLRNNWISASLAAGIALFGSSSIAQQRPALEVPGQNRAPSPEGTRFIPTLYDQTGSAGTNGFPSQNFEKTFDAYDAQGADDFVVPAGEVWGVTQVYIPGSYTGTGSATSVDVFFYANQSNAPGGEVYHAAGIVPFDSAGDLAIPLAQPALLAAGTYWLSVRVNMNFDPGGQWFWSTRSTQTGSAYRWRNPGNGFGSGCTSWQPGASACGVGDDVEPDALFSLLGFASSGFACNNPPEPFGAVPPAGWSVESAVAGGPNWATIAGSGLAGNFTGGSGGAASLSSDFFGPHAFDARLVSKTFSLIGAQSASVRFLANYQNYAVDESLDVDVSTNGGTAWANLLS